MEICSQREIYEKIYREHKIYQEVVNNADDDTASRRANIFAVEHTTKMWKAQFKDRLWIEKKQNLKCYHQL